MYKEKNGNKYVLVKNISGRDLKGVWATNEEVKVVKGVEILGYYLQIIVGIIKKKGENVKFRYWKLTDLYKIKGLWGFLKWTISGSNRYIRYDPEKPILTLWTLKELLFHQKSDFNSVRFQHQGYKSLYVKTLVPVHRYYYEQSVLFVPIILYPFVKLYFLLKILYYHPVRWFYTHGYITIETNQRIPRLWFLKLHRRNIVKRNR